MGNEGEAFLTGAFITAVIFVFILVIANNFPGTKHNIGWDHIVCVSTTDRVDSGALTTTEHCVTGEELARWAQARNR